LQDKYSCALANFSIDGMKPGDVVKFLFEKYKIHSTPIEWDNISGTRITPHIYTAFYELDRLNEALEKLVKS
jgi:selenocysteine lyase/cysteine desulfurase